MMKKIWNLVLSVLAIVVISGCGGDPMGDKLKLTVGSKTITESNTERETIKIGNQTKKIAEVKVSDFTCDLSLNGQDAGQFDLDNLGPEFKSKVQFHL